MPFYIPFLTLSCFLSAYLIFPQLIPLLLLYVLNANGTTPSPMETAGSSTWWAPTRQGKRLEKRKALQEGRREMRQENCSEPERELATLIQILSFTLLCYVVAQSCSNNARNNTFCPWKFLKQTFKQVVREGQRDIRYRARYTARIQRKKNQERRQKSLKGSEN